MERLFESLGLVKKPKLPGSLPLDATSLQHPIWTPSCKGNVLTYIGLGPMSIKHNPSWKVEVSKSAWIKPWQHLQHFAVCFMQQVIKFTEAFTRMTWFLLVLWFDITHTDKHTEYKGTNRLTHTYVNIYIYTYIYIYKYILKPHVMCTRRSYLYCTELVTCWNKNLWSEIYLLFKNFTCGIHTSANKIQKGCVISVNHYLFMKTFWKLSPPLVKERGPTMKKVIGSITNSEHFI